MRTKKNKRESACFSKKLSDASYYEAAIEKLHAKFSSDYPKMLYEIQDEGHSFAQIFYDRRKIARILAKEVGGHVYQFSPANVREKQVDGKPRLIYSFTLFDRIVHTAVFSMLAEDMQHCFSDHVYSYRAGRNRTHAIQSFMRFMRTHREQYTEPKNRGVYVYRFDIKSYGETIPLSPGSTVWAEFYEVFKQAYGVMPTQKEKMLIHSLIHPEVYSDDGGVYENIMGIVIGAPISALLLNLYVGALDRSLAAIKGSFYARYGDDIIFVHRDIETFANTIGYIKQQLNKLGLSINQEKSRSVFFNAAGREKGGIKGSTAIKYLGMQMQFNGTMALKAEKVEDFMRDLRKRVSRMSAQLQDRSLDERGKLVCSLINKMLEPRQSLASPYADLLQSVVNDRGQLKDVDYRIARLVLKTITGDASVKQFRKIPYKKMREEWKLISLEYQRNRGC
ncbi:MAG: reverse transcriptase domain-containing protein [Rickettsiales bacterium]